MTNASSDGPWISLCCKPGELYQSALNCYRNDSFTDGNITLPTIYDQYLSTSNMSLKDFVPRYGMQCENGQFDIGSVRDLCENMGMRLFENGTIYMLSPIASSSMEYWIGVKDYCLSYNVRYKETALSICRSILRRFITDEVVRVRRIHLGSIIIMGLPLPFLVATFIVYTILPELRNIHGLILRIYIACLFIRHIVYMAIDTNIVAVCYYSMEVIMHFSMLAVFFWLNVMCFDIWWTFRKFKPLQDSKRPNWMKLFFYSIYAWGCPALFVGVGAIADNLTTVPKGIIRPGFHDLCWFTENSLSKMIYLDGPIAITLLSNACFFVSTSVKMIRHKRKMAQQFNGSEGRYNDGKQRFNLHLKLFIVMGITRCIQFILTKFFGHLPKHMSVCINLPNSLQGLAIFIIFVWKDNIKKLLLKRIGCEGRNFFSRNSMEVHRHSASITPTTPATTITSLQEDINISLNQSKLITEENTNLENAH